MPQCNGINNPLDGNTAAIGRDVQCSLQPLGGDIAADKQALCDVEEDELGVCAHSAAFSVQSRSGGETPRALFFYQEVEFAVLQLQVTRRLLQC